MGIQREKVIRSRITKPYIVIHPTIRASLPKLPHSSVSGCKKSTHPKLRVSASPCEKWRLIHRTEQNLRLLEALGSSAPKGITTSTLAMGFACAMELNQWFYAPTPQQTTKNLYYALGC